MEKQKVTFGGHEYEITLNDCVILSCEYRMTRDWDTARVYALTCVGKSDIDLNNLGDDVTTFAEDNSMFNRNYVIMQSDAKLRNALLTRLRMTADNLKEDGTKDTDDYDREISKLYEGKRIVVKTITISIDALTGHKFKSWTPPVEGATATRVRTIPFVGDATAALERAAAQVLADCEESESEEGEE